MIGFGTSLTIFRRSRFPASAQGKHAAQRTGGRAGARDSHCALQVLIPEDSVRLHVVTPSERQNAVGEIHAAQGVLDAFGLQEDAIPFDHLTRHDTVGKMPQQPTKTDARDVGKIKVWVVSVRQWGEGGGRGLRNRAQSRGRFLSDRKRSARRALLLPPIFQKKNSRAPAAAPSSEAKRHTNAVGTTTSPSTSP